MADNEENELKGCAWVVFAFFAGIALCILASKL